MERIEANGVALAYELSGSDAAPTVVLSHSLAAASGMWEPQVTALSGPYRILSYDMRGHGESDAPEGPYSFEMLADDVAGLMDALGIERAHFVGLSIGGMIGQHFALRHPDKVDRLALCSTTSRVPAEGRPMWDQRIKDVVEQGMESQVAPTIDRWFTPDFLNGDPDAVAGIEAMIRSTPTQGLIGCAHAIRELDVTGRLGEIEHRTLVMPGELDEGAPVAASEVIANAIPNARLRVIPGVRHLSNVERPDLFNEALSDFLDER